MTITSQYSSYEAEMSHTIFVWKYRSSSYIVICETFMGHNLLLYNTIYRVYRVYRRHRYCSGNAYLLSRILSRRDLISTATVIRQMLSIALTGFDIKWYYSFYYLLIFSFFFSFFTRFGGKWAMECITLGSLYLPCYVRDCNFFFALVPTKA